MSKILPTNGSANFSIDGEHEKSRMKEVANELASLVSYLNLGSEEMPFEENVRLVGENNCQCKVQHGSVGGFGQDQ